MVDKVQKIYEEVERMHNLLPVMDGDNISVNYADRICTTLEMYIDSLQKEPVSKVWHDVNEKPIQEKPLFIVLSFKNYKDCRNKYKVGVYGCRGNNHPTWVIDCCYSDSFILKWAYIDEIINL